jgi:anti-sigma regulatory factor (Ser/Thr protein kinase)
VKLTLPPTADCLADVRRKAARSLHGIDQEVVADVLLALDEAVGNAIRHGSGGGMPVQVSLEREGEWIELTVRDGGPTPRAPRLPAKPPPALATGGRGLWLILQLVDEARLQRVEDGTLLALRRRAWARAAGGGWDDGTG